MIGRTWTTKFDSHNFDKDCVCPKCSAMQARYVKFKEEGQAAWDRQEYHPSHEILGRKFFMNRKHRQMIQEDFMPLPEAPVKGPRK